MKKPIRLPVLSFVLITIILLFTTYCKKSSEITPSPGTVYFLVSELSRHHDDSYILPLTDPDDIETARRIVNGEERSRIVSARIARGSGDGNHLNKNLSGSGRTWSWHVSEFIGFVDVTAEIYDSWPGFVEDNLDFWMQQNKGIIGFWSYTVTRIVDPGELD